MTRYPSTDAPTNRFYGTRPQSVKTTAAPRNPATINQHEVTSS